ncbi:feruloyl CoA ortho-hydroxylase F6H1-3-like [Amaranthus tricolor]|uniref:feruloyl CoA ortho-hydroxylase F6H1-3-like n=1 Tax=Amaranthus tricolor TaxID=29722 RepID=UPI00258903F4|nr:feruloyl CoA ortho-hydroxylase F6H1-3-like [Amaranthus tricolor]
MSTFSPILPKNINEFVQNQGQGVKGLADIDIKTLPNQYIQPPENRFNMDQITADHSQKMSIPIIDMSNQDDATMEDLICDAAEKWGFLQIVNHGVGVEELEDLKRAAYRFFELGVEEKAKYLEKNSGTVNVKYGTSFAPNFETVLEWKDYLSLLFVSEEDALTYWPIACRDEVLNYVKGTENLLRRLFKILLKGLNIHEIDKEKELLLMGSKRINLNCYPKCPNPELTYGVSSHSDVITLTILLQDEVGGLYVRKLDDEKTWIHVPPIKGALVINIGDSLQILSNGKYKSIEHLVIANGNNNRVSIPIFVMPSSNHVIAPFQEIIDKGDKPMYKGVLYSNYLKHFYGKPHDGKATIEFATISS